MNGDHSDALRLYCNGEPAEMAGIDADGFDVLKSGQKLRFAFETPVHNMEEAREALVKLARSRK